MVANVFHTVRHLRPIQVYRRLYRRRPSAHLSSTVPLRERHGIWKAPVSRPSPRVGDNRFRFLNQEREPRGWNDSEIPRLWLYNLHYFEAPDAGLIGRWMEENAPGAGTGWEPYPLSLRIGNWIKWSLSGGSLVPEAVQSLAQQTEYLSASIEYHLLANHLFANAKALALAGMFFDGPAAARWLDQGLSILDTELEEQILADGGHFERSPMYHSLIVEDVLDLINFGRLFLTVAGNRLERWSDAAARMLGWLRKMTHPDGRISFFNDAAFGIAPEVSELLAYGRRLGVEPASIQLAQSGYIRLSRGDTVVLFDAAPVGPDYQPGHAHADTLSLELSVGAQRLLVNTGTSTYEAGPQRLAERGTAAHNTVRIDDLNSSEVWSAFRVARRARPFDVSTIDNGVAEAAHDGYRRLSDPVIHRRRLELLADRLLIKDSIEARGDHKVEIFFHLHPDAAVQVQLDAKLTPNTEATAWRPEFNVSIPNRTIVGRWAGRCPTEFVTTIPLP